MQALKLEDFATPETESTVTPLVPIADDAILKVSPTLTLAVCKRGTGEPVLARFVAGKAAKGDKAATEDGYRTTGRIADIARAIAGGLLA